MDWAEVLNNLAKALPGIRNRFQFAGAVVIAAALLITKTLTPGNVPAYVFGTLAGAMLVGFGLIFNALEKFQVEARPGIVLKLFFGFFAFMLIFSFGWVYFMVLGEMTVDVYLRHGKEALRQDFEISYTIPGRGPDEKSGKKGHVDIRGVPRSLSRLQIDDVTMNGFTPDGGPSYEIKDGKVEIGMVATGPVAPWPRSAYPDPSEDVPAKEEIESESKVPAEKVLLTFVNETNDDLFLVLYNCSTHYRPEDSSDDWKSRWIRRPFSAKKPYEIFNKFEKGSGWYVVYIATQDKRFFPLGRANLYETNRPKIVVTKPGGDENPYKAEIKKETADERPATIP